MSEFIRRCKGKVMGSINDRPGTCAAFEGHHIDLTDIRYSCTNQHEGLADVAGDLIFMKWEAAALRLVRLRLT